VTGTNSNQKLSAKKTSVRTKRRDEPHGWKNMSGRRQNDESADPQKKGKRSDLGRARVMVKSVEKLRRTRNRLLCFSAWDIEFVFFGLGHRVLGKA